MTTESDNALPDLFVDDCQLLTPQASSQKIGGVLIPGFTDDVTDGKPDAGSYEFGGSQADWKAGSAVLPVLPDIAGTENGGSAMPAEFRLLPNSPNPFTESTTLLFDLPMEADVRLEIFNVLGERIRTWMESRSTGGSFRTVWDGRNDAGLPSPSGVFILRLTARTASRSWAGCQKLVLVR
jgi:hypothetical protein